MGEEVFGEYSELSPVEWLDPLERFVSLDVAFDRSQPLVGKGGGTFFGTYAVGWLALRDRRGGPVMTGIWGEAAPLRDSPFSYVDRNRVELNWLRKGGRPTAGLTPGPKLESEA